MSSSSPPPQNSAWPAVAALAIVLVAVVAGLSVAPKETLTAVCSVAFLGFGIFAIRRT